MTAGTRLTQCPEWWAQEMAAATMTAATIPAAVEWIKRSGWRLQEMRHKQQGVQQGAVKQQQWQWRRRRQHVVPPHRTTPPPCPHLACSPVRKCMCITSTCVRACLLVRVQRKLQSFKCSHIGQRTHAHTRTTSQNSPLSYFRFENKINQRYQ